MSRYNCNCKELQLRVDALICLYLLHLSPWGLKGCLELGGAFVQLQG
jgi:hypothetical protein